MSDTATIAAPKAKLGGTDAARCAAKNRVVRIKKELESLFVETRLPKSETVAILTDIKRGIDELLEILSIGKERRS